MTANKERFTTSFDTMQSKLCFGCICFPTIFKGTRPSQLQFALQFKPGQERNMETNMRKWFEERFNEAEEISKAMTFEEEHEAVVKGFKERRYLFFGDWLPKFTEFIQANGQPHVESSSATYSQDEGHSLKDQYTYVIYDQWQKAGYIYQKWPELKIISLTSQGDTALHLAVSFTRTSFFNGLMDLMTPEELEVQNKEGKTAFFMCVSLGNVEFAQTMLRTNSGLAMINEKDGLFPIHMAAMHGHRQMLQLLCPATVLDDLQFDLIVKLFFMTLENNIFDVANALLEHCPGLAASRSDSRHNPLSPLHVLARKPREELYEANVDEATGSCGWGLLLIRRLWTAVKFMEHDAMNRFISDPSNIVFDAAESGNIEILDLVFQSNPGLLTERDRRTNRNLFHIAVLSRQENVLLHLIEKRILADVLMLAVDYDGNNMLHFAGMLAPTERFGSSRPHIQMQRELLWFKEVENRVPTSLKTMKNCLGFTPKDVLNREHEKLHVEAGVAAKDTANYGMLVATIIATIVFAASLTVPGHDVSPKADSSILQMKGWYIIFILSNSVALFTSSSSIFFFLSVLTSSFAEEEFISALQVRLMFGVTTLFVAITTMVVAFTAACFLIFNHLSAWVAYLVASLGSVTVALFVFLLYNLFGDLIRSLYWSRHLFRPANYSQRLKSHITAFTHTMKELTSKTSYKLRKMPQNAKAKKRLQEDNPVAEP